MAERETTHRITLRTYVFTYVGLCALAGLSWLLAELPLHTGLAVALAIAGTKAGLVMAYFMHLAEESFDFTVVMAVATALVLTLVVLTTADALTRSPYPPSPFQNASYHGAKIGAPEP